jgi:GrpB-like predicted nucleotidyltransferase (UPF0157 family)
MRKVEVVPYDTRWPDLFWSEAERLREALDGLDPVIHHIGSTSVPGFPAKPVIDVMAVVSRIESVDKRNGRMLELGYVARGENGIPGRRFFTKEQKEDRWLIRTHHVHVFEQGSPHIVRHLAFRDYLRHHPDEARRYGELKLELARLFPTDIERYIEGKSRLVAELESRALQWWRKSLQG